MRTITTRNSVYEINEDEKLIRRVSGTNPPPLYLGKDGVWQPYVSVGSCTRGLLIEWPGERWPHTNQPATWTSGVVSDEQES